MVVVLTLKRFKIIKLFKKHPMYLLLFNVLDIIDYTVLSLKSDTPKPSDYPKFTHIKTHKKFLSWVPSLDFNYFMSLVRY